MATLSDVDGKTFARGLRTCCELMKAETQEPLLTAIMRDTTKLHVFMVEALTAAESAKGSRGVRRGVALKVEGMSDGDVSRHTVY